MTEEKPIIINPPGSHTATVIWLHGLGADGHDFEPIVPALGLPQDHGIRFVFPHAPVMPVTINGGMEMRAWYDIKEIDLRKREDAEGIKASRQILENLIAQEKAAGIPATKIVLAGFSQGGVVILQTGLRHKETLAGLMALSTYLPLPETLDTEASIENINCPIFMGHGVDDPVIPVHQGKASRHQMKQRGYSVEWHEYPMQHSVSMEEVEDIGRWLTNILLDD